MLKFLCNMNEVSYYIKKHIPADSAHNLMQPAAILQAL